MCHAIKRLFYELGVGPTIYEVDEESRGKEIEWCLMRLGCNPSVPAVFIGGKFVGTPKHSHDPSPQWLTKENAQRCWSTVALARTK